MNMLALLLAAVALSATAQQLAPTEPYRYYRVGSRTDVHVHPRAGYALMGGGTDLDEAFRWLCDRADGGDFLVIRATGTDAYNPYIQGLCHLNSVTTLVIPDGNALDLFAKLKFRDAAAIFIAGGDQARYINFWARTPVERLLRDAVQRGIPIGGTSAGLAVLGQYIYSAQNDLSADKDLTSDEALANPFYRQIVIANDLLAIPALRAVITDSHFDTRHREGRLLAFMARIRATGSPHVLHGIGVDERTAVLVEPDGTAQIIGKGEADFFEVPSQPRDFAPGNPLSFGPIKFDSVKAGSGFDLDKWRADKTGATLWVRAGHISLEPSP
jgi:cyanophycinase